MVVALKKQHQGFPNFGRDCWYHPPPLECALCTPKHPNDSADWPRGLESGWRLHRDLLCLPPPPPPQHERFSREGEPFPLSPPLLHLFPTRSAKPCHVT